MTRILTVFLVLTIVTTGFSVDLSKDQRRMLEMQSVLKSGKDLYRLTLTDKSQLIGTPIQFEAESFLFLQPMIHQTRSIEYLSLHEVKTVKCLCGKSAVQVQSFAESKITIYLELIDSSKCQGHVVDADETSFGLLNVRTMETRRIEYSHVKKISAYSGEVHSLKWAAIGVGVAFAAIAIWLNIAFAGATDH